MKASYIFAPYYSIMGKISIFKTPLKSATKTLRPETAIHIIIKCSLVLKCLRKIQKDPSTHNLGAMTNAHFMHLHTTFIIVISKLHDFVIKVT